MSNRVLIVDDDPTFTQMVQYWLEKRGLEVDLCANGGVACETAADTPYVFVLMDYFLPTIKGDEVCQTIRDNPALKALPIVIMTAFTDYDKAFFIEKGANDVLYKPVSHEDLMAVVDKYYTG
jgi:DNA-binding response OmpR family regulator